MYELDLSNIQIDYAAINASVEQHFKENPFVLDPEALKSGSVVQKQVGGKTLSPVIKTAVTPASNTNKYLIIGGVFLGVCGIGAAAYFITNKK